MQTELHIKKVAILGSGVMGAQIAAHFGNAGISVVLFDLKSNSGGANLLIDKSLASLAKLNPKPLAWKQSLRYITPVNYTDNLDLLTDCNLIIEAIAERLDWKADLYQKISSHVNKDAIIASNTSGLSIEILAENLPEKLRANFCGIHFFNPPRYMPLVELIPHKGTKDNTLIQLESFLVTSLGKSIIIAKDTPNFIANRLGVFSMLATCIHTKNFDIPLEVVDKLTGKDLGRAKSGTYRTADVVGLDTFAHVVATMQTQCKDGWDECYTLPSWLKGIIDSGALGQKTKAGIYKKDKDGIKVFDLATSSYRLSDKKADKEILDLLRTKDWSKIFDGIRNSKSSQAQFLWSCFRDIFHYAATLLGQIADTPRQMDLALRWGFAWKEGLFEIWQQAGWQKIATWIQDDINANLTLAKVKLPQWVMEFKDGVYIDNKHFNIKEYKFVERKELPVYARQLFPDLVLNERTNIVEHILYENTGVKLWHTGDNVGILSFKSKMCSIGIDVLKGIEESIDVAEKKCVAMVIWQEQDIFSAGANLEEFGFSIMMNGEDAVDQIISEGHRVITQRLSYCNIPVVAAVKGYAFGGGCEILLHCSAVVAALESYIGLVEAGVGIIPGWGGSKEMALRAANSSNPWQDFEKRYKNLAMAQVATSAREAQEMGFLRESDTVVMNVKELLLIAKQKALFMAVAGYRAPLKSKFKVFGEQGIATVNGLLVNMFAGNQISEHDLLIARNLARVMCGGEVENGSEVSEDWVLRIEKDMFKQLAISEKSAARMQYMLETGKPLRN